MARLLTLRSALALLAWTGGGGIALACSVPVFRYALERWVPDDYVALVLHHGPLLPADAAVLRELERGSRPGGAAINLAVRTINLATTADPVLLRWRKEWPDATSLPTLALLQPAALRPTAPAWQGPFTAATVAQVLDSPLRREIAGRLLRGANAHRPPATPRDDAAVAGSEPGRSPGRCRGRPGGEAPGVLLHPPAVAP
ncbi:MAG: hypothetical protein FJ399_14205 [Verrucomicrobia bacterium]|nr:hypothetical protein [Verrucomicrobiota bacterium]